MDNKSFESYKESLQALSKALSAYETNYQKNQESLKKMVSILTAVAKKTDEEKILKNAASVLISLTNDQKAASISRNYAQFLAAFAEISKPAIARAINQVMQSVNSQSVPSPAIIKAVDVAEAAIPYAEIEKNELPYLPEEARTKKSWWNVDRVLYLISLLFTLYFGFAQMMPDEQLEEAIRQREVIIEKQDKELEESRIYNKKILGIMENLEESILDLTDELNSLKEQADEIEDGDEASIASGDDNQIEDDFHEIISSCDQ